MDQTQTTLKKLTSDQKQTANDVRNLQSAMEKLTAAVNARLSESEAKLATMIADHDKCMAGMSESVQASLVAQGEDNARLVRMFAESQDFATIGGALARLLAGNADATPDQLRAWAKVAEKRHSDGSKTDPTRTVKAKAKA